MIRIGIAGYGNIGRGVECNIKENDDMELVAIFTRRDPVQVKTQGTCPVLNISELENWKGKIDVLVIAGGSATDLPEQMLYREDGKNIELRTLESIGNDMTQELQNNGWSLIGNLMTEAA